MNSLVEFLSFATKRSNIQPFYFLILNSVRYYRY